MTLRRRIMLAEVVLIAGMLGSMARSWLSERYESKEVQWEQVLRGRETAHFQLRVDGWRPLWVSGATCTRSTLADVAHEETCSAHVLLPRAGQHRLSVETVDSDGNVSEPTAITFGKKE
jgi:hypothetical protein